MNVRSIYASDLAYATTSKKYTPIVRKKIRYTSRKNREISYINIPACEDTSLNEVLSHISKGLIYVYYPCSAISLRWDVGARSILLSGDSSALGIVSSE